MKNKLETQIAIYIKIANLQSMSNIFTFLDKNNLVDSRTLQALFDLRTKCDRDIDPFDGEEVQPRFWKIINDFKIE